MSQSPASPAGKEPIHFVRKEIAPEMPPPNLRKGVLGWMQYNLFSNFTNSVLTVIALYLLWQTLPALYTFALGDAVWIADDGEACRLSESGACWAYIGARMKFFIYGFYPAEEQWRVNIVFLLGVLLLTPLVIPRAPYKLVNAILFIVIYPIIAVMLLSGFSITLGGSTISLTTIGTEEWGGLTVTLVIATVGIVFSLPFGIVLALGRRSEMPAIRTVCVLFIELWRGIPLITVLFMASIMLPLFLPQGVSFDKLVRALVGVALFSSAYMAEVVRGGLQAIPKGQYEAASALGLNYWKSTALIILPQTLKIVIPGIVNTFIALFKDTSLVAIVGIFDLLSTVKVSTSDLDWASPSQAMTGYAFAALVYFFFCFGMSRYSLFMERRLDTGHKS